MWVQNLVSHPKGGTYTEGVLKLSAEENNLTYETGNNRKLEKIA
jgi:hypothetical protein